MYDYYAFWNGATMAQFFNYVAALFGSGDFTGLMRSVALLGLIVATSGAVMRFRGDELGKWLLAFTLFESVLIVPKVTVRVWDVRAGTVVNVANVPLGLGMAASEMSHIGKFLTDRFETLFNGGVTAPGAATDVGKFSNFGLAGPQRVMRAALRATAADPVFRTSLDEFVHQCVFPELADNPGKLTTITSSTGLWATITSAAFLNPARMVTFTASGFNGYCGGGGADAVAALNTLFTASYNDTLRKVGITAISDYLDASYNGFTSSTLATTVATAIGSSDAILIGSSRTADVILKDAIAFNQIQSAAAASGESDLTAWAVSQANMASEINYSTMARIAESILPQVRTGIEALIVAVFPIMIIILMVTGHNGGVVLKAFIFFAAWIQLWPPLYSVVNALTLAHDGAAYATAAASLGGTTPQAMAWIAEMGASAQSTAGMFALSVPVIALAIIKGGEQAFSSLASSVMGPAAGTAQSAGTNLAAGNIQSGNTSWGNTATNNTSSANWNTGNFGSDSTRGGTNYSWGSTTEGAGSGSVTTADGVRRMAANAVGVAEPGVFQANTDSGAASLQTGFGGQLANGSSSSVFSRSGNSSYAGMDFSLSTAFQTMNSGALQHAIMSSFGMTANSGKQASFGSGFSDTLGAAWTGRSGTSGSFMDQAGLSGNIGASAGVSGQYGEMATGPAAGSPTGGGGYPQLTGPQSPAGLSSGGPASGATPVGATPPGSHAGPGQGPAGGEGGRFNRTAQMSGSGKAGLGANFDSGSRVSRTEDGGFVLTSSDGRQMSVSAQQMDSALRQISETASDGATRTAAKQAQAALTRAAAASHGTRADSSTGASAESNRGFSQTNSSNLTSNDTGVLNAALSAGGMTRSEIENFQSRGQSSPYAGKANAILGQLLSTAQSPQSLGGSPVRSLEPPAGRGQVQAEGDASVKAAAGAGDGTVRAQNARDNASLNAQNPSGTTATTAPVNNGAGAAADGVIAQTGSRISAGQRRTNMASGAAAVSAGMRVEEGSAQATSLVKSFATFGLSRYSESDFRNDAAVVMEQAPNSQAAIALNNLGAGRALRGDKLSPDQIASTAQKVKEEAARHRP